jgi:hypothetical protein
VHVYRPSNDKHSTKNPAARPTLTVRGIDIHLGRRPPPPTAGVTHGHGQRRNAQLPPGQAMPVTETHSANSCAEDANDFESIRSLMYEAPADNRNAIQPGKVVQLTETSPANSSLEIGLLQRWQDPQVAKVMMREIKTIEVTPGEPKTLFTFGLAGCIAVSILSRTQGGTISATLSHRPPEELDDQLREIQLEIARHQASGPDIGREILILAPGGYEETGGQRELQPAVTAELAELVRMLDAKLPGIVPTLVSYHPRRPNEQSDALVIDFPVKAGDPVLYKGIYSAPAFRVLPVDVLDSAREADR